MFIYKTMAGLLDSDYQEELTDEEYDPHEHRRVPKPTTYIETFAHMIKGSLGAGILAIPLAMAKVGLIIGISGLCFVTMFATYSIHVLIKAQYALCQRHRVGYITYPQSMYLGAQSGPRWLRWSAAYFPYFVDSVLIVWQLGLCCVYIVFISESIKQVLDVYHFEFSIRMHMCFILLPLIAIDLPKGLKVLAPLSTLANILTIAGLVLVFLYLYDSQEGLKNAEFYVGYHDIPVFVGITLFALEAVGVILALEYNMENPARFGGFCGLFNLGMSIILLLYLSVGVFGYIKYGKKVSDSLTLSLPPNEVKAQATKLLFAGSVLLSYPLQNFVAYEIIWHHCSVKINVSRRCCCDYILRIGLVLITFGVAVAIPQLGPFISLFGALCLSMLGIIFPGILDLCVRYPYEYGPCHIYKFRDYIMIILGMGALFSGSYTSVIEILHKMAHEDE